MSGINTQRRIYFCFLNIAQVRTLTISGQEISGNCLGFSFPASYRKEIACSSVDGNKISSRISNTIGHAVRVPEFLNRLRTLKMKLFSTHVSSWENTVLQIVNGHLIFALADLVCF